MVLINFYLLPERQASPGIEGLNLSTFEEPMAPATELQDFRYEYLFFLFLVGVGLIGDVLSYR